jgi:amino acid transporter
MFNALWQKWLSRISGSSKNIALGHLILTILLSFVSGLFWIQGIGGVFRGDMVSWIWLISSPAMLGIAIAYARLVWQAIE